MKRSVLFFYKLLFAVVLANVSSVSAQNYIINGDFSSSSLAWVKSGTGYFQYDSRFSNYHSSFGYAYLADFSGLKKDNINGSILQNFFLPSGVSNIEISFWYNITTDELPLASANDTCGVSIKDLTSGVEYSLVTLSNGDATAAYAPIKIKAVGIPSGRTWQLKFSAQNNGSKPTVFRIDDVAVSPTMPFSMNCISWAGSSKPANEIDTQMEKLCSYGIISSSQSVSNISATIPKIDVARVLGKAILYLNNNQDISFLDYFPNIYPELNTMPLNDQRYMKLMLYLEYRSIGYGTDNITPFSRDFLFQTSSTPYIKKSEAIKAVIEAFNIDLSGPAMAEFAIGSSAYSTKICDMRRGDKTIGWVEKARELHLLDNITFSCTSSPGAVVLNNTDITSQDFYTIVGRALEKVSKTTLDYNQFFVPTYTSFTNLNGNAGEEKGVFNDYSYGGIHIQGGGLPLDFSISYHSNLTEIPVLTSDFLGKEDSFCKPKLQPLGGGWTHTYSAFIKSLDVNGNKPERMLIYWPDGTIHSYNLLLNKYETKGVTDKLTIDSFNVLNQPSHVTVRRGRMVYVFRNIDPALFATLSLVSIADAYNNKLDLQYAPGVASNSAYIPQLLSKIVDSFSGRSLLCTYWTGTNYLKDVTDPIGRKLTFYPNPITHDLDSSADAKNQITRYSYFENAGTIAFRPHLLTAVKRPNGNTISSAYNSRKVSTINTPGYVKQIQAVPLFQSANAISRSIVTTQKGNQEFITNFYFDRAGNQISSLSGIESTQNIYDTATNRIITARDINHGIVSRYGYDANGFLNKIVVTDSVHADSITYTYVNNSFGEVSDFSEITKPWSYPMTRIYRNAQGSPTLISTDYLIANAVNHSFSYDSRGLVKSYTDPVGFTTNFDYSSYGTVSRVYKTASSLPTISEYYQWDGVSRLTKYTDAEDDSTMYQYDNNDNLVRTTIDSNGLNLATAYTYDANDNLKSITSPKGHTTTLSYNFYTDNQTEENDGINKKQWRYNIDGSLDTFINKNNVAFKYLYYDSASSPNTPYPGRLQTDGIRSYIYDQKTKDISRISQGGVNNIVIPGKWGKPDFTNTIGFFSSGIDQVAYKYDNLARITFIGYPTTFGPNSYAVELNYNDDIKQLTSVKNAVTFKPYAQYEYGLDGSPHSTMYGNGDSIFYHYDGFNRLDSIWAKNQAGALLYGIGAVLDKTGKRVEENLQIYFKGKIDSTLPPAVPVAKSYTYEKRNRILTGDGKTFSSTGAGEIDSIYSPSIKCKWSQYEKLTSINNNGVLTIYEYEPGGVRKRKNSTYYVTDANTGQVLMEATQSTTPISLYVWGNGLVARVNPNNDSTYYYHYDFNGNVIAITDQAGQLLQFYKYDPYGAVYAKSGSLTWNNPYQYVGRWGVQTDDSDVYYMKARYYQPSTGRFLSEDPQWDTNLFTYGDDDPTNRIDPIGLKSHRWNEIVASLKKSFADPNTYKTALNVTFMLAGDGSPASTVETDYFAGTSYSSKVDMQIGLGDFHSFPENVRFFQSEGTVVPVEGADGVTRQMLKIPGSYMDRTGFFEFIKDPDGVINHRFFNPTNLK